MFLKPFFVHCHLYKKKSKLNGQTCLGTKDLWFDKYNMDEPETKAHLSQHLFQTTFFFFFFSSPDPKGQVSYCHHWASIVCRPSVRPLTFHILINSSETTGPIWTKLWWNGPWMAPFQAKNRKKGGWNFNCSLLL
jgi:hypothetical protein